MSQVPRSLGLILCDQVIFERETLKPSLIGCFTAMNSEEFPFTHPHFDVYSPLTDGLGTVILDLVVVDLENDVQIYAHSMEFPFPDPLQVINLRMRVRRCAFPHPGTYLFTLFGDGEELAHRRVLIYQREE